jgi:hypothetical protein
MGAEIVEAAIVLPLMFTFLLGIYYFGRAYNIYATVNQAAREGARVAAAPSCATCGDAAVVPDAVADIVGRSLLASHLDPTQVTALQPPLCACGQTSCGSFAPCLIVDSSPNRPQVCIQTNVLLDNSPGALGPCGVAISFQYPYTINLPIVGLNSQLIQIKAQVQMKGEF